MPQLKAFVSRGEPVLREDGTMDMVPVQLIDKGDGRSILRVGNTTFWFDEHGNYDGTEHAFPRRPPDAEMARITDMLEQSPGNRGFAPETPYFQPGSKGYRDEVRGWEEAARDLPEPKKQTLYTGVDGDFEVDSEKGPTRH